MRKWIRRIGMVIVALIVLGGVIYAFLPQPVRVDLAVVERGQLEVAVEEDGKTRIRERYVVSSPLGGRLMRIELDAGDEVASGNTILARIEPTDPELLDPRARAEARARVMAAEARLQQTEADKERALSNMQFAESELARGLKLFAQNSISSQQMENLRLLEKTRTQEFRAARFAEEIARFEVELAKAALLRTAPDGDSTDENWFLEIPSPITGRVLRVIQKSATVVTPGTSLLELGDPTDLEIVVEVLSSDAVRINPGDKVQLVNWGGEAPLLGVVRLVEPSGFTKISALGVEEQRVNVIVDFAQPTEEPNGLGDGFRVDARIIIWEGDDVLRVPTGALFREEDDWAVYAVRDGRAVLQIVELGHRSDFAAEIRSGLEAGERVVVYPSDQVSDGVAIQLR